MHVKHMVGFCSNLEPVCSPPIFQATGRTYVVKLPRQKVVQLIMASQLRKLEVIEWNQKHRYLRNISLTRACLTKHYQNIINIV